ncbi:MAG: energy transducer TonB [Chlorobi bacterium]|nr:energy transducer TonB [Chlorobiota bacterium]
MKQRKNPKSDLERKRVFFFEAGFIITLLLVFSAFEYQTADTHYKFLPTGPSEIISEELPPVIPEKPKIELPPPQVINLKIEDNSGDDYPDIVIDVGIGMDDPAPYFTEGNEPEDFVPEDTIVVTFPDKQPEFPGGTAAMFQYLHDNIKYPSLAKETNIQGTVFIGFVIERDGSVSNVKVLRPVGGGCDEEAVRVVQSMPRWKPGMQHGRPVRVSFNMPVKFVLR